MHVNYCDMGWHLTCSPLLNDATLFPAYLVGSKKEYLIMILLVNTASFVQLFGPFFGAQLYFTNLVFMQAAILCQ